jgi:signal transduction histidine kinase
LLFQSFRGNPEAAAPGEPSPGRRRWRRVAIIVGTLAALAAYVGVILGNLDELEQERREFAMSQARKILLSFESHTARLFDMCDIYLRATRHFIEADGMAGLAGFLDSLTPPRSDLFSSTLTVLDGRGRVKFSTDSGFAIGTDLSDQAPFLHFRETMTDDVLVLSHNRSTVADQQYVELARPLIAGGELNGVVLLSVRSSHLAAFYSDMTLGPNSSAAIFGLDHSLIARQPPPVAEAQPLAALQIWGEVASHSEGVFHKRSGLDGIERTFLYKRLGKYPVVMVVGLAETDMAKGLEDAWRSEIMETSLFALTALAFAVLVLVLDSRNSRLADAERKSRAAAEMLERSNADLERFAYVASHDLKTPLRVITGYAQMLDRRYRDKLDDEANEYIAFLTAGTKRMYRLITDLLHYSRINSQAKPLQPVSAARACDIATSNLKAVIEETGAVVTVGPLPTILADESQLSSLLQNLLGNALKYRDPLRKPEIKVEAVRLSGSIWRFAVRDNGIGIEPEHFERIFVIFQRLHADAAYEGTGIGLALCQRIVTRLGGRIWVESKPGEGSTFYFTARDAGAD